MHLIQKYFFKQALIPLLLSLSALSVLALLTQSLSTIDLIVENRQSAQKFLYITVLALPQLFSIIIPLAVFMAVLYALNRFNLDRELMVSKASGLSPWQICVPSLRIGVYALIVHLILNLFVQPYCMRKMRKALLEVRSDVASKMVKVGEFNSPAEGLIIYANEIRGGGEMRNVLIYDRRSMATPLTYMADRGKVSTIEHRVTFSLFDGSVNQITEDGGLQITNFSSYTIDLSDIFSVSPILNLKKSDRYLYELFNPDPQKIVRTSKINRLKSEAHARLSSPLYNIVLVLLALAFLVRGEHQKMGYMKRISLAAVLGFGVRLVGITLASAAESSPTINIVQYAFPLIMSLLFFIYLKNPKRIRWKKKRTPVPVNFNIEPPRSATHPQYEAPHA